jgi:hypothetical protein
MCVADLGDRRTGHKMGSSVAAMEDQACIRGTLRVSLQSAPVYGGGDGRAPGALTLQSALEAQPPQAW